MPTRYLCYNCCWSLPALCTTHAFPLKLDLLQVDSRCHIQEPETKIVVDLHLQSAFYYLWRRKPHQFHYEQLSRVAQFRVWCSVSHSASLIHERQHAGILPTQNDGQGIRDQTSWRSGSKWPIKGYSEAWNERNDKAVSVVELLKTLAEVTLPNAVQRTLVSQESIQACNPEILIFGLTHW